MSKSNSAFSVILALVLFGMVSFTLAQSPQLLKRTITKTDKLDFGAGGTVAILGAPDGSIRVRASKTNEVEISAVIEIQAATEADLARIAQVTTFVTEETVGRVGIVSVGTHNKLGDKKLWKKFPKDLLGLPFRIDYTISVPKFCDLQIDGGKGELIVSGVEGLMRINSVASDARIDLVGGGLIATFGVGTVDITMPDRSWRGNTVDAQLASGTMSVHLPQNLSADLDATVMKTGKIENSFTSFKPRSRNAKFTDKSIIAKAGSGGVSMKFTVGDGTLRLLPIAKP